LRQTPAHSLAPNYDWAVFLPVGTDRPLARPTLVNHVLIGLNVAVYLGEVFVARLAPDLLDTLRSQLVLDPGHSPAWTYLTYAFLHSHGHILHLLGNMLFLWVFGPNVEDRFGRIGYTAFYLVGAVVAGLIHALFDGNPVIGASGAIAGVTGAFLILFPRTRVHMLTIIGPFSIAATWFIGFAIARDIFFQSTGGGSVAYAAHIGGYVWGAGLSLVLLWTHLLDREIYDLFSIMRQASRRRQIREAARHGVEARALRPATQPARGDPPANEPLMRLRAEVTGLIAQGHLDEAADRYEHLLTEGAAHPSLTLLNRRHQLDLSNHLLRIGRHAAAAAAYQKFLDAYPTDHESASIRLMLGLVKARYLDDPDGARELITSAMDAITDERHKALGRTLLAELDHARTA